MLRIEKLVLGPLYTNTYIVYEQESKKAIIIDPADSGEFINSQILDKRLQPLAIISTHGHFDHVGAVLEVKLAFNLPFLANEKDNFLIRQALDSSLFFSKNNIFKLPLPDKNLKNRDRIRIGSSYLEVLETPGHTPGSISLISPKIAFVGDLMFSGGTFGRDDFSYSDKKLLGLSVRKIECLPRGTTIYPGHGEVFKLRSSSNKNRYC